MRKRDYLGIGLLLGGILLWPAVSWAGQYINPKKLFGDPAIAWLPQGKEALSKREKEEIERYGYTALELMIYSYTHKEPGRDNDRFDRITVMNGRGQVRAVEFLCRYRYYYNDIKALVTHEGIKPGELQSKMIGVSTFPADDVGSGGV